MAEDKDDTNSIPQLSDDPGDVRGVDAYALTRTSNFRRALLVLDKRPREVEGLFESIRVAPGRIDTVIVHPDNRLTNIQVRPDFEIAFENTSDFPTPAAFRAIDLSAHMRIRTLRPRAFLREQGAQLRAIG